MIITMLPTFAIPALAANNDVLFHYSFDNSAKDLVTTSNSFDVKQHWPADSGYNTTSDHYHFSDGWIGSDVGNISGEKDWRIDFTFKLNNINNSNLSNGKGYILGLSSSAMDKSLTGFFGITLNGNLCTTDNSVVSASTKTFNTTDTYILTYIYHRGEFTALLDGTPMVDKLTVTGANKTLLEDVKSISIGGCNNAGSGIDSYDLIAREYSYSTRTQTYLAKEADLTSSSLAAAGLTVHGTVNWDDTEEGAYFNGSSYLEFDSGKVPLTDVTDESGFTVSVDVKTASYDTFTGPVFSLGNSSTNDFIAINGGDNSAAVQHAFLYKANGVRDGLYPSDFDNTSYVDMMSRDFSLTSNDWHTIKVSLDGNGYFRYYVDNELRAVYKKTYNGTTGNVSPSALKSKFAAFNAGAIGKGMFNEYSTNFVGYIRNVKFSPNAYDNANSYSKPSTSSNVNKIVGAYLTKDGFDGIATRNNVSWSNDGAYFTGSTSYLTLEGNPMHTVNSDTGFTISVEIKPDSTIDSNQARIIDFGNEISASSSHNLSNYFFLNYDSDIEYTPVFSTSQYNKRDTYRTAIRNNTDQYKRIVLTFKTNGRIDLYSSTGGVTDVNVNDFKNNASTILNSFQTFTDYYVGKSHWNDPYYKGYMRNLYIFNSALSVSEVDAAISEYNRMYIGESATIEQAKQFAKDKLASGRWQNTEDVYMAYINACEAVDADTYAGDSSTLETARTDLIDAINKMVPWSEKEYVGRNYGYSDSSYRVYENDSVNGLDNYRKLAYSATGLTASGGKAASIDPAAYIGPGDYNYNMWGGDVYYPETTMIYDGYSTRPRSTILISLGGRSTTWDGADGRVPIGATFENSNGLTLTENWHGGYATSAQRITNLNVNNGLTFNTYLYNGACTSADQFLGASEDLYIAWNDSKNTENKGWRYIRFVNRMSFTGDMTANESYRAITPDVHIYLNSEMAYRAEPFEHNNTFNTTTNVRVINYKRVMDYIKGARVADLDNYLEGGATYYFRYLDDLTTWNNSKINNYFTSSNNWNDLATAMNTDVTNFVGSSAVSDTRAEAYQNLRDALTATRAIPGTSYTYTPAQAYQGGTDSIGLSGYTAFKAAYENALEVFEDLNDNDNTSGYNDNTLLALQGYYDELTDTFEALLKVNLHAPVITPDETYLGKGDGVTITNQDAGASTVYELSTDYDSVVDKSTATWDSEVTYNGKFNPFGSLADNAATTKISIRARSKDGSDYSVYSDVVTVTFLSAPSITTSSGTNELAANGTVTVNQTSGLTAANSIQYSFDNSETANHWNTISPGDSFAPFGSDLNANDGINNTNKTTLTVFVRQICGTSVSPVYSYTVYKSVGVPSFSVAYDSYLNATDTVEITDSDTESERENATINYKYGSDAFSTYSGPITPFSGKRQGDGPDAVVISAQSVRNGKISNLTDVRVKYLSEPTFSNLNNEAYGYGTYGIYVLNATDTLTVTQTSGYTEGQLQYSFDNVHWNNIANNGTFAPFSSTDLNTSDSIDNTTATTLTLYIRQEGTNSGSYSYSNSVTVYKKPQAPTVSRDGALVDKTHGVWATLNTNDHDDVPASIHLKRGNGEYAPYTSGTVMKPFAGADDDATPAANTYYFRTARTYGETTVYSDEVSITVGFLSRPTANRSTNDILVNGRDLVSLSSSCDLGTSGMKYRVINEVTSAVIQDWTDYTAVFNPFVGGAYKVKVEAKQESGSSTSPVLEIEHLRMQTNVPTINVNNTSGNFVSKNEGFTITNNDTDAASYYRYSVDGGAWTSAQLYPGTEVKPFENKADNSASTVEVQVKSMREGVDSDWSSSTEIYFLNAPTINNKVTTNPLADNDELTGTEKLGITSNNDSGGELKYYISDDDGAHWRSFTFSEDFAPFALKEIGVYDYTDDVKLLIKATQVSGDWESDPTDTFTIIRKLNTVDMYWKENDSDFTSTNTYGTDGKFFISNTLDAYSGKTIYYQKTVDGVTDINFYPYNINTGIDSSTFASNEVVGFKFYIIQNNGKTVVAEATFAKQGIINNNDNNMLVYHESFDGASASGTSFTGSTTGGINGTVSSSDGASVIAQWDGEQGTGGDGSGNVNSVRKNVLKINASNSTGSDIKIVMSSNPLADSKNSMLANLQGVTISFWRAYDAADYKAIGREWQPALAFVDSTNGSSYYMEIMGTGPASFSKGAVAGNVSDPTTQGYYDFINFANDPTTHAAGDFNPAWVHYVLTIDPNSGVTIYTNGEPHEVGITDFVRSNNQVTGLTDTNKAVQKGGKYTANNAILAKDIIEFITKNTTNFVIADGGSYNYNSVATFLDDIRIYTKVKTQVDINNMYTDTLTDAYSRGVTTKYSTSHDPTNVTVYKLTVAHNGKSVGSTVGEEFIQYHNIPKTDYTVEYYSFGTGMTVYKSTDNINWTVLGDDAGRCGYQNEKLFGGDYTVMLAEPLAWTSGKDGTSDSDYHYLLNHSGNLTGAGFLQWAPHVMYNVTLNKWCYYGSTSDWNSSQSCVFMGTSDNIEGPYTNIQTVYYSGSGYWRDNCQSPANAIDSCVYYGHNSDGTIDPEHLYMTVGSWGPTYCVELNASTGLYANATNLKNAVKSYANESGDYAYNALGEGDAGYAQYAGKKLFVPSGRYWDGDKWVDKYEAQGGSGEGGYVVYRDGYYYFYISLGSNGGTYTERVFRSQYPDRDFVAVNGNRADTENGMHGNNIITPYYLSQNEFTWTSVGHNSVYTVYNADGDPVDLNAVHTRPYTKYTSSKAMVDGAMATRQSDLRGNVAIHNPVVYTENGWPVAMPLQYDNTFSTKYKADHYLLWAEDPSFTAYDFEGTYEVNELLAEAWSDYIGRTGTHEYTFIASDDYNGIVVDGFTQTGFTFEVSSNDDQTVTYITLYDSETHNSEHEYAYGVIANQGAWGSYDTAIVEFAMVKKSDNHHIWGVRTARYPRDAVNAPEGVMVEMDKVVYTHLAGGSVEKYGQEISDNINYINNSDTGERVTTFKVKYPYYVDSSDSNAILCLNDVDFVAQGHTRGNYKLTPVNSGNWFYTNSSGKSVDLGVGGNAENIRAAVNAMDAGATKTYLQNLISEGFENFYHYYIFTGDVSTYFDYGNGEDGGYPETGLQLLIQYKNGERYTYDNSGNRTGNNSSYGSTYGEYKFPFVMPNPAWAHTIVGSRNLYNSGEERRFAIAMFTRMEGSFGSTTDLVPASFQINSTVNNSNQTTQKYGVGNFEYLYDFNKSAESVQDSKYGSAANIFARFEVLGADEGVNAGAFTVHEHYDGSTTRDGAGNGVFTAANRVVNAEYYIDYSDPDLRGGLVTTDENNNPTGYKLNFYASNLYWAPHVKCESNSGDADADERIDRATSYVKNVTGLAMTTPVNPTTVYGINDKTGNNYYNIYTNVVRNTGTKDTQYGVTNTWLLNDQTNVTSDITRTYNAMLNSDGTLKKAFNYIDTGYTGTGKWVGQLEMTGSKFQEVPKASGNTAETASNFVLEQGLTETSWWNSSWINDAVGGVSEQVFNFYNVGVDACDKGAVRELVETWANKEMIIGHDEETGRVTTITPKTVITDGIESEYINAKNYSVESYDTYLDAVAEAYWFLYNPRNTHMSDYDSTKDDVRYSTAYGVVNKDTENEATHALIYADETGQDIFGDNASTNYTDEVQAEIIADIINAYENLFSIEDFTKVKDNYSSISFYDDKDKAVDKRNADPEDIKTITITTKISEQQTKVDTFTDEGYTADSWANFVNFIKSVVADFDYYYDESLKAQSDVNEWRYVPLDGEQYAELDEIITAAKSSLMPVVDTADLQDIYNGTTYGKYTNGTTVKGTANGTVEGGIFDGGTQLYTYSSWAALNGECKDAKDLIDDAATAKADVTVTNETQVVDEETVPATHKFEVGKYAPTNATKYTFGTTTFYAQNFTENDALDKDHYKSGSAYTNNCSEYQGEVYDAYHAVDDTDLVPVDDQKYTTFDYTKIAADGIDSEKYIPSALDTFLDNKDDIYDEAYHKLTSDEATAYNTATNATLTANTRVKSSDNPDVQTADLMGALTTLNNANNIKKFWIALTVQDEDGDPIPGATPAPKVYDNIPYGTSQPVSINDLEGLGNKNVDNWAISYYKYGPTYENYNEYNPISSSKLSGVDETITRAVNNNMHITATVSDDTFDPSSSYKVVVNDMYKNISDIFYITSVPPTDIDSPENKQVTFDSYTVKVQDVPFYSFDGWDIKVDSANRIYTYSPRYTTSVECTIDIVGATIDQKTVDFDRRVDIVYDNSIEATVKTANSVSYAEFKAWAVQVNYGTKENPVYKYQIASYNRNYTFYSVDSEKFVPVMAVGDSESDYRYVAVTDADGTITDKLTASMMDCDIPVLADIDRDTVLEYKLDNSRPFISVQKAVIKGSRARVYVRLSTGASGVGGYGVIIKNDCDNESFTDYTLKRTVTNILSTGQFTYTLNNKNDKPFSKPIGYRGFVTYDVRYSALNTNVNVNINEYSNGKIAAVPAAEA